MNTLSKLTPFDNESELIHKLYASLTDKDGFHTFLQVLGKSIGASACILTGLQRSPIAIRYIWQIGLPEDFTSKFRKNGMLERDTVLNLAVKDQLRNFSTCFDALQEMKSNTLHHSYQKQ